MTATLTRRAFVGAAIAAAGLAAAGCGAPERNTVDVAEAASQVAPLAGAAAASPQLAAMTVYRDPSCGCCGAWAEIARQAGYQVTLVDHPDMPAVKRRYDVPEELASCHTTVVDGYAIEGHVPLSAVARLLDERPRGIRGIAVPGMPRGSPGMEMPDGSRDRFQVIAFDTAGGQRMFSAG